MNQVKTGLRQRSIDSWDINDFGSLSKVDQERGLRERANKQEIGDFGNIDGIDLGKNRVVVAHANAKHMYFMVGRVSKAIRSKYLRLETRLRSEE